MNFKLCFLAGKILQAVCVFLSKTLQVEGDGSQKRTFPLRFPLTVEWHD